MLPSATALLCAARLCSLLALAACAPAGPAAQNRSSITAKTTELAPKRVISVDYCADQYALKLLRKEQLLALSPDATAEYSFLRKAAVGVRQVRARAEDILALQPDLILRTYGGGPNATAFFERAGVRVVNVPAGNTIAGALQALRETAAALSVPELGATAAAAVQQRFAALTPINASKQTLYLTPAGFTSGSGTLVHELLTAAGLRNFEAARGWRPVSLERLVYERPELIAAAFFEGSLGNRNDAWNPLRHPLLRQQLAPVARVTLPSAWTACGGWFVINAVERLHRAAQS